MADAKFLANRLKFHTASRVGTQTGQALAQALNVDGHIVTTLKIWDANENQFPNNADKANTDSVDATNDLVAVFKKGATSEDFWNGGKVWTNPLYSAVKLYEGIPMTTVEGSDGGGKFQAYEINERDFILTSDEEINTNKKYYTYNSVSKQYELATVTSETQVTANTYYEAKYTRIVDWVAPTAVAERSNGQPVAGFSGIPMYDGKALKLSDAGKWAQANGTWQFVYMSGMLIFEPGYTPQDKASTGATKISLTEFKYVGNYLSNSLQSLQWQIVTDIDEPVVSNA